MTSKPLVSCIMPTYNRRRFVSQAIWYFLRQDYPARELIIVDDGEDAVADLVPGDEHIRYVRLDMRHSVGAKRNIACELSRGELIAHWDDDDWMAPNRLSAQVAELSGAAVDVCGARDILYYHLSAGQAWLYRYPPNRRPWLAGCTLLYRRSAWTTHPFPDRNVGEDTAFVRQFPSDRLHAHVDTSWQIAIIHPHNESPKSLTGPRWRRRPISEISPLLAADRDFYVAWRNGQSYQPLSPKQPLNPPITVAAPFIIYDGYGSMAEYLVRGLDRCGAQVKVQPLQLDLIGLSNEFKAIFQRAHVSKDTQAPVLYFCWLRSDFKQFRDKPNLFINTMWESSQLPQGWAPQLNQARAVIVPSRFVARVCHAGGVTVPIVVIPEGIDPDIYHYEERPERPGLTTLIVGTYIKRKHTAEGIAAWKQAFAGDPEARLIIKARFQYRNYVPDDPRIRFVDTNESSRGIAHWYREADILLALGNEGFGLPLVEGMATGLPVIALNSEGQSDICEDAGDYLLPVAPARWEVCDEGVFGRAGVRGVPGVEEIAQRLRWVASHRNEANDIGRAAADWVRQHRNIWAKAPAVLDVLERHMRPTRPLRRVPTLWVPSWHQPCGVAQYTTHITQYLSAVRVTGGQPDLPGVQLLHIQHGPDLFQEKQLRQTIQQARRAHIPVVATSHLVARQAYSWEGETDVLVALTPRGANRLRKRWPDRQVVSMPHGCPTWFPPRKRSRGRVIGVFGFLELYKGFWQLLDVLRQLPDTELLMYSYAKSADVEARWTESAAGLPVHRVRQFLPVSEVARRLAAEADILVFWYSDVPFDSPSGAVRIGLATGVPVLASPTSWFHELRGVTYQPDDLVVGVQRLLDDTSLRRQLTASARDYCQANRWQRIAERHQALWRSLV